jgi:hypothetical protein
MKITKKELQQLIKEEATKMKRVKILEAEKQDIMEKLKKLDESYMEEETIDEVSPDEAAHAEAMKFLSQDKNAEAFKNLYKSYKQGNKAAGAKMTQWFIPYAIKNFNKSKDGASDLLRDVMRVLEDNISGRIKSSGGASGGLGV